MEGKTKRTSLITGLSIVFSITVVTSLIAMIAFGHSLHKYELKKEAEILSVEVATFMEWVLNASNAKSHSRAIQEFSQIHSETTKRNIFKIVDDNPDDKDSFEAEAIKTFKRDNTIKYLEVFDAGTYRYAQPLIANAKCLKCHTKYKSGEVSGIITVDIYNAGVLPHVELKGIVTYVASILAILALMVNFIWFKTRIIEPLGYIDSALKEIREGKYDVRITLPTRDEFGDLGNTLNTTMDKLTALIQTDEERMRMQENIIKFLDILSLASEGDFTQRAEVTPDIFGSLGDAYNLMLTGLTELIEQVKNSAEGVNNESMAMINALKELERGAETQMQQLRKATESVNQSAMSAVLITEKTSVAQEISDKALIAITNGSKAVESSIEGMQLIRLTIQAINKRMKYLSEKLMEIITISHLINEIANRTNILAINASIEAARAGEQGKGFVIISDEIRSLAEKAAKSTKQITDIINAVQTESSVVTKHLEEETKYVEIETKTAESTEAAFKEIEKTITDMTSLISEINSSAAGQKELTADVVSSMQDVQSVSLQVLKLFRELTDISNTLTKTSEKMVSSIARFKLR